MADPFEQLRMPTPPADPPERFVMELRARYIEALNASHKPPQDPAAREPATAEHSELVIDMTRTFDMTSKPRAAMLIAAAVVVALLAVGVAVVSGREQVTQPEGEGPTSSTLGVLPDVEPLYALASQSATLHNGTYVAVEGDSVGVTRFERTEDLEILDAETLTRRHLLTNVGYWPQGAFGSFWVFAFANDLDSHPTIVRRVDPHRGSVLASITMPAGTENFAPRAVDATGLWLALADKSHSLVHISAETNAIDHTITTNTTGITSLTFVGATLWAVGKKAAYQVDAADGRLIATIEVPAGNYLSSAMLDGQLWIYGKTDQSGATELHRLDPTTGTVADSITTNEHSRWHFYPMTVADGTIWCTTDDAAAVAIDPDRVAITGRYGVNDGSRLAAHLTVHGDNIWLLYNGADTELHKIPIP